jgi:hypothetical protein
MRLEPHRLVFLDETGTTTKSGLLVCILDCIWPAVFRENAIVAGSRPMSILPRAAIAANVPRIGRADSARCKGGVGQGAG